VGGTLDGHDDLSLFGALQLVSGRWPTRLGARPTPSKRHRAAQDRDRQEALARPLREVVRAYPAERPGRVVMGVAKASWQKGALLTQVVAAPPPLER
jgi:hypothetical protein